MRINLKKLLTFFRASEWGGGGGGIFSRRKSISALTRSSAAATILAAGAYFSAAENAEAGKYSLTANCSLSAGTFASVTIGNMAHAPDIIVPFQMTCTTDPNLVKRYVDNVYQDGDPKPRGVGYCFHIHNKADPFRYRVATQMGNPANFGNYYNNPTVTYPYITYNFYADNGTKAISAISGANHSMYNIIGWATRISDSKFVINDTIILRFEGNEGRKITPGTYSNTSMLAYSASPLHGGISAVPINAPMNWDHPGAFCKDKDYDDGGGKAIGIPDEKTAALNVNISVKTYCTMSIRKQAAFPTYASLRDVKPITATLNVDCSAGTHYRVTSNMGLHAKSGQRYMKKSNSDATIAYNIDSINTISPNYKPAPAEPLRKWTDYGNGTPAGINYDIQFSIPRQTTPPDGTYKDTIVYTLNHIPEAGDITDLNNMNGYTVR